MRLTKGRESRSVLGPTGLRAARSSQIARRERAQGGVLSCEVRVASRRAKLSSCRDKTAHGHHEREAITRRPRSSESTITALEIRIRYKTQPFQGHRKRSDRQGSVPRPSGSGVGRKSPLHRSLTVAVLELALFQQVMTLKGLGIRRERRWFAYARIRDRIRNKFGSPANGAHRSREVSGWRVSGHYSSHVCAPLWTGIRAFRSN